MVITKFSVDDFWLQRFKADVYGKANIDDMEAKERKFYSR